VGEIIVVTGANLPIGRRVVAAALAEPGVDRVVAIGAHPSTHKNLVPAEAQSCCSHHSLSMIRD
jgi:phosphoribosylpyrophosphate synthetase